MEAKNNRISDDLIPSEQQKQVQRKEPVLERLQQGFPKPSVFDPGIHTILRNDRPTQPNVHVLVFLPLQLN